MLRPKDKSRRSACECSGSTLLLAQMPTRLLCVKRDSRARGHQNWTKLLQWTLRGASRHRQQDWEHSARVCQHLEALSKSSEIVQQVSHCRFQLKLRSWRRDRSLYQPLQRQSRNVLVEDFPREIHRQCVSTFASPWTLKKSDVSSSQIFLDRSCPTATYLTHPMPALMQIPTAAAESVCILRVMLKPRSRPTHWIAPVYS